MKDDCPGCHEAPSRNYDEDCFCEKCRQDIDQLERWAAYASVIADLVDDGQTPFAAGWVGEA